MRIVMRLLMLIVGCWSLELCDPPTASYPCSACQPYATLTNGLCSCPDGMYMDTSGSSQFCGKCHTSCKKCSGPLRSNCISCPDDFELNSNDSTCEPPDTDTDETLVDAYSNLGFTMKSQWYLSQFSTTTVHCGANTLLGGTASSSSSYARLYLSSLPNHFNLRVKVTYFILGTTTGVAAKITVGSATTFSVPDSGISSQTCLSQSYRYHNIDHQFAHTASSVYIYFGVNKQVNFGIREVFVIAQKCASNCSSCDGYLPTECLTCSDSTRKANDPINNGTCLCKDNYYQEPYSGSCTLTCPSVPTKYYGDNATRYCTTECSSGYAYDGTFRCLADCPTTDNYGNTLFRDQTNKKCATNCPDTEPYGDTTTRYCYSTCPANYYKSNTTNKRCVDTCPNDATYKTYAYDGQCVAHCPDGTWAHPTTKKCETSCSAAYPYKDNSTGDNICVTSCPAPNHFADATNLCVDTCPDGTYGDDAVPRLCVSQCVAPLWGLISGSRKCVGHCPSDTWAEPTDRICVDDPADCGSKFASDLTRQCIDAINCPSGLYADNSTHRCQTYCSNDSYGHPTTKYCQAQCGDPYFRDAGVNLCVTQCKTQGTYADVSSTRTCVTACNTTGSTPWADDSTQTCVDDCNQTVVEYLSDNTTWKCVYFCPDPYVADFTTTVPKCVSVCPTNYFADFSSGTGICVQKCSAQPPQFGDDDGGLNLCVSVCAEGTYGDETGNRRCVSDCPDPYFSQNDDLRRCVLKCNDTSYGWDNVCEEDPHDCPNNYFGDDSTNLCVSPCPAIHNTYGDSLSKMCVSQCPDNPDAVANTEPDTYFADESNRLCVLTCNGSHTTPLFGNNHTKTCVPKCIDHNSYAEARTTYRLCVARCLDSPAVHYANNFTKVCGVSSDCPTGYYGQNDTQLCLERCPNGTYGFNDGSVMVCVDECPSPTVGDVSTGKPLCVDICPTIPELYADLDDRICVGTCPSPNFGQPIDRTCVSLCPATYFSYEPTRKCIQTCPLTYYGDDTSAIRKCHPQSSDCTYGYGDDYTKKCESVCTGPAPVNTFGSEDDCVSFCPNGTYADSHTGTRTCVALCPPGVTNSVAAPNLYGDPTTHTCVAKCITPHTWADSHTRLCESECTSSPPTYSENIAMTCVTSLNCPSSPTMTFGDNTTRSCTKECSNDEWGDPTSRYCVAQCPNASDTGTTHYYGDDSTGQSICVQICPQLPRKFGENGTNLCVEECPIPTYGEQTGSRLCVAQCPLIGGTQYWFAQNTSRICVKVCETNTWGLKSSRECVEDAFDCGSLWADNSTFLCVSVCPASVGTFGDPTTKICTPVCPDGYYADDYTRECVAGCPSNNGQHDTFANNQTNICEEKCTEQNAYGDPQTAKRYCVTECSQSPEESFADPSSKLCVPECPSHPDLYAQSQNHTCISSCPSPYYANTHTRRCESSCEAGEFKLNTSRVCVTECPSDPDLFADSSTGFCESTCSSGYKYSVTRTCVTSCADEGFLEYDGKCVTFCPDTYYANSTGNCLDQCPSTTFGQNTTTTCVGTCITGYAHDKLCLAICPDGKYGQNHICEDSCTGGRTASNVSNLCVSTCDAGTYMQNGVCQTSCSSGYADPNTHLCSSSCTAGRFGDPTTDTCVETCPSGYFQDSSGFCKDDCSPKRADAISGTCTNQCSDGLWGYNYECIDECPDDYYGYESTRDCSDVPNRPATTVYGDDVTQTWVTQCPYEPLTFADPVSKLCVEECESSYFADPESRKCETSCTNSSYYADSLNKKCVLVCPEGYQANPDTGTCQQNCTNSRYDYKPTRQCVTSCPKPYYGYLNSTQRVCVLDCPSNTFAEGDKCELGCTSPLYADSTLNRCVSDCVDSFASDDSRACQTSCSQYGTIADNSTNKCVAICPTQPDYYEQNDVCVMHCSSGFADPQTGVRECTSLCTEGRFGDPVSGRCLTQCLPGYYAYNDTNLCVEECPDGFADNSTGKCVADCPAPTFADSLNNKCMKICSGNQFGEGRVCVDECTDPLYGNPLTRTCDASCSSFDYLFAQNTTNMCVKDCSFVSNSYADRNKNMCMDECSLAEEYALAGQGICTSLCPDGLFMENSTKKCQSDCDTGYAEPTSRYCVQKCFGNPQTFAYIPDKVCVYRCLNDSVTMYADNTTFQCVSQCPSPYFSDPISGNCVLFCPEGLYSETDDRTCTANCPDGYADNKTRSCVAQCPQDEETFGDPHSKECVKVCPDGMVAEDDDQICVDNDACPTNTWSDIISKHCVSRCPSQPLYFGYNATTSCVQQCPSSPQLYGDYVSQTCITACTSVDGELRFADPISRTCVFVCPILNDLFGDTDTGKCTDTCSNGQLRDNSTQRCVDICPSDPDYYADNDNEICVRVCPDGLFASDATDRQCIADCTPYLTFADPTTNRCSPVCPQPYFADNSTYKCVLDCPSSENYFADPHSRTCVKNCPSDPDWITFAQDIDRTCVTRCPTDHYAQNSSGTCVDQCPTNQYADTTIQRCVADCTVRPGEYKQTNDRVCVSQCPITPTKAHKYEVNHTCVQMTGAASGCPGAYYANPLNDMCTTLCPYGYFAETWTKMCVEACSESSEYADPYDRKCKSSCTSNPESFAYDGVTRTCVKYCPEPYFSENQTWTCTTSCPSSPSTYFKLQTIRSCVLDCPPPYYAYSADQQCVLDCPDGLYAQDSTRTCEAACLLNADNSTNKCVKICPQDPNYFAHNHVCVLDCPDNYYRDISTRQCVPTCPVVPLLFADNSTNTCVEECPVSENYFADNITKKCVLHCFSNSSITTFADVSTRSCVLDCPPAEDTYADPISGVCQPACTDASYYKSSLTHECVTHCPDIPVLTYAQQNGKVCVEVCQNGKFGNNDTLTCDDDCSGATDGYADSNSNLCVSTCPVYFFAYDDDSQCVRDCPDGLFADSSTRKCVPECPGTERLYADSSTNQCVSQCPTGSYGDSQDWICKDTCPVDTSGYRLDVARQCVDQCPEPYFAFVSSRICVNNCGNGLYGDPITRECKDCPSQCPTCLAEDQCLTCDSGLYLSYGACVSECILNDQLANYANNVKMLCVEATKCPSNTFASNSSKSCQSSCPVQMYGNSTTRTCQDCPSTCLGCINSTHCTSCIPDAEYSQVDQYCYGHCNSTHRYKIEGQCYASCIDGTYLDYTAVNCEACNQICKTCEGSSLNCTSCDNTFLYEGTCVNECPQLFLGKDNICVKCTGTQCDDPLNFEIISTVEDYRETIVVKFNKKTNITGDPKKFMKIKFKIKNKRLLQDDIDYESLFNEGVQFEAEVLPDGTIKIYPMPGMTLLNFQYQVVFTDSSYIVTEDGSTLQDLEGTVEVEEADVYPSDSTTETPFITVGFVLSIIMLACTFFMLIFGLSPFFIAIEAFQIFSLYAYCPQIAPNLFYFLKELRFTRFAFMPNIFYSIYVQPSQYDSSIPQKVLDTEGQLSFAVNSMGFMLFLFLYLFYAFVVFILTSKINNNRPLKNLFIRIWDTRIKFGLVNDFLWLFSINTLVGMFVQFKYTANGGDLALAILFGLAFIAMLFGFFGYAVKKYREDPQSIEDNFSEWKEGSKDGNIHRFFIFLYYLRKILFSIFLVALISEPMPQAAILLTIFAIYLILIPVIRPYKDNLRNFVHFAHEGGLTFINGGIIFFIKMVEIQQPVGSKVINGEIIAIIVTIHLCIALIWGIFRSYIYLKQLRDQFKKTEFYKLYLDEEYDQSIEKQISELNQQEKGEVQSVEIANTEAQDEEQQIIRLKIKRKVKKDKKKGLVEQVKEMKNISKNKGEYVKIDQSNQKYYEIKANKNKEAQEQFEKMVIDHDEQINMNIPRQEHKERHDNEWVMMEEPKNKQEDAPKDNQIEEISEGKSELLLEESKIKQQPLKQDIKQKEKEDPRFRRSYADFDERNYFYQEKEQKQAIRDIEESREFEDKQKQENVPQKDKKRESIYDAFDFDGILQEDEQQPKIEEKDEGKNPKWDIKMEDLLQEDKNDDEEIKKKKEKSKKIHMSLFDDEDFD